MDVRKVLGEPFITKTVYALLAGATLWLAYYTSTKNYLLFHTLSEMFTIVISITIGLIVLHSRRNIKNDYIPILGLACAFASIFDLLHTLAYVGLGVFPEYGPNLAPQMWLVARYLESVGMFLAGASLYKTIKPRYVFFAYLVISIFALLSVFMWKVFPVCFIAGQGLTPFKVYSEYVICLILTASIMQLLNSSTKFHHKVYKFLLMFYSTSIATELSFTLYHQMYGFENLIGHLFKIAAFFCLYRAIVETSLTEAFDLLFFQLNQAYKNIKANQEKLLEAEHIAQVGSFEINIKGNRMYWSEQMYTNMGFAGGSFTPTLPIFLEAIYLDDRSMVQQAFCSNFTRIPNNIEVRVGQADCIDKWLRIRYYTVADAQGAPETLFGIAQDISESKRYEAQLQRYAAELEDKNQEIKSFADIVSHDLRAPLVNLKGFSKELEVCFEQLERSVADSAADLPVQFREEIGVILRQDAQEALTFIYSSLNRMDRMISALLKLSRLERRELQIETVELSAVVGAVLQSFKHQLESQGIEVEFDGLSMIQTDHLAIEQIISNLVDNAIKYLSPEREGRIKIHSSDEDDHVVITVEDNGIGIAKQDQTKIFEIFQRIGIANVPGEGMGLAYVKKLARQMGGKVWCESEPGIGTKMSVSIPKCYPDTI